MQFYKWKICLLSDAIFNRWFVAFKVFVRNAIKRKDDMYSKLDVQQGYKNVSPETGKIQNPSYFYIRISGHSVRASPKSPYFL